jgi:hypothetical protein
MDGGRVPLATLRLSMVKHTRLSDQNSVAPV